MSIQSEFRKSVVVDDLLKYHHRQYETKKGWDEREQDSSNLSVNVRTSYGCDFVVPMIGGEREKGPGTLASCGELNSFRNP